MRSSIMFLLLIVFICPLIYSLELEIAQICGFILLPSTGDDQNMYIVHSDWTYNEAYISSKSLKIHIKERTSNLNKLWPNLFKDPWPLASCPELVSYISGYSDRLILISRIFSDQIIFATMNLNNEEVEFFTQDTSPQKLYQVSTSTANDLALIYSQENLAAFDLYKVSIQNGQLIFEVHKLNTLWMNEKTFRASFNHNEGSDLVRNQFHFGPGFYFKGKFYLLLPKKKRFFVFNYPPQIDVWSYNLTNVFVKSKSFGPYLIIGTVVGVIVAIVIVGLLIFYRKLKANKDNRALFTCSNDFRPGKERLQNVKSNVSFTKNATVASQSKAINVESKENDQENTNIVEVGQDINEKHVFQNNYCETSGFKSEHETSEVLSPSKAKKNKKNQKKKASALNPNKKISSENLNKKGSNNESRATMSPGKLHKPKSLGNVKSKRKKIKSVGKIKSKGLKNKPQKN